MGRERTNPFRGFVDLASEMYRMRELGRTGHETGHEDRQRTHATAWIPSTNIFTRGRDLVIQVSLSGIGRDSINIAFSNGVLTISGERGGEPDEEELGFHTRELYYGAFRRNIILPEGIDENDISADFDNGMLEITAQGGGAAAAVEPRRIEIGEKSN